MKYRIGFVTNSSSTCYIITNKTDRPLTVIDFIQENPHLIKEFNQMYDENYDFGQVIKNSYENNYDCEILNPGENVIAFGDEDGTFIGTIFDYILRDGGESKSFKWRFKESWR